MDNFHNLISKIRLVLNSTSSDSSFLEIIENHLEELFSICKVSEFPYKIEFNYIADDFKGVAEKANKYLSCCISILDKVIELKIDIKDLNTLVFYCFLICAEHNKLNLWSSKECLLTSNTCIKKLCAIYSLSSITEILDFKEMKLLKKIINIFKEKLTVNNWMKYPGCCASFEFVLHHSNVYAVSEQFDNFLPASLMFVDDFMEFNVLRGICCLHEILSKCSKAELKRYDRIGVIYDSLQRKTYTKHAIVIEKLHPTLILALSVKQQTPMSVKSGMRPPNEWDEIFSRLLVDAHLETSLKERYMLIKAISLYLPCLGLTVVRHFEALFELLKGVFEQADGYEKKSIFEGLVLLRKLVDLSNSTCVERRIENVSKLLLKLLLDTCMEEIFFSKELAEKRRLLLIDEIIKTFIKLDKIDRKKTLRNTFEKLVGVNFDSNMFFRNACKNFLNNIDM